MSSAEPFVLTAPLSIIYQDEYIVAVDKPSGMLVHRSFLDKHETVFVMQTLRDQLGQHVFPVHRLDRPTSGVLLFALSSEVARLLGAQQEQQLWRKFYLAVVRGYVVQGGELDYALKEQLDDIADKFSRTDKAAQQAITRYQSLAQLELPIPVSKYPAARYSLVALQPLTGRKHQLRRHLAQLHTRGLKVALPAAASLRLRPVAGGRLLDALGSDGGPALRGTLADGSDVAWPARIAVVDGRCHVLR